MPPSATIPFVYKVPPYRPYVVRILNERSTISQRLALIVDECHELRRLNDSITAGNRQTNIKAMQEAIRRVNALLSKYRWQPLLSATSGEVFSLDVRNGIQVTTHEERKENEAVDWLMRHIKDIHKIRRCRREQCGKWLWAEVGRTIYCASNCRKSDHAKKVSSKAHRAEYMREYREKEKLRSERAIQLATGDKKR